MKIAIISGSMMTSEALKEQLTEYAPEFVEIDLYGIDDHFPDDVVCDLAVYSSDICYKELQGLQHGIVARKEIVAERTIDFDKVEDLFKVQKVRRSISSMTTKRQPISLLCI